MKTKSDKPDEPVAEVQFWLDEIDLAKKREEDYRKTGEKVISIYSGKESETVPFNILFSNVETFLPALFSQTPRPVVKRRFNDDSPLGLAASKAGERMLSYLIDPNMDGFETFEQSLKASTVDALLPGRGMLSVKYDVRLSGEVKEWENVYSYSRKWDRVYFGQACKWADLPWMAYEEYIDKEEASRLFGEEIANQMVFSENEKDDSEKNIPEDEKSTKKTAVIYQIWDKDGGKRIKYISPAYGKGFLRDDDDSLGLSGFYNCPKPLQFVEKSSSMVPTAMYKLYESQANELNELTRRIKHIARAIKARGLVDGALGDDLEKVMNEDDTGFVVTDKGATMSEGGFDKSIWFMPVEKLIVVLQQLYEAREQCKRVIYEITGISDIIRGSSRASETLGAQKIKESWGTLRLKRLQQEVQRYARDTLRIMLEIAATKFDVDTWKKYTGLQYPTQEQKMQVKAMAQVDPNAAAILQQPSWEEVLGILKDDVSRSCVVDIETNSTIDIEATEDQKNASDFMNAMGQLLAGLTPMVEAGAMPFEAAQSIMLAVTRKYRFGTEVEEQLKNMKPPQQNNPEAEAAKGELAKVQADSQAAMMKMQQDAQMAQAKLVSEQQQAMLELRAEQAIEQARLMADKEIEFAKEAAKFKAEADKQASQRSIEQMKANTQRDTELKKAAIQGAVQIEIAKINAASASEEAEQPEQNTDMMKAVLETQNKLLEVISAPKPPVDIERNKLGQAIRLVPNV